MITFYQGQTVDPEATTGSARAATGQGVALIIALEVIVLCDCFHVCPDCSPCSVPGVGQSTVNFYHHSLAIRGK